MITHIESIFKEDDYVHVTAVVEDTKLIFHATWFDPPEYGAGLCKSSFLTDEDEVLPEDDDELIAYLNSLELDWILCPDDDY